MIIQVGSFKLTGRRVFRMAPLQHHFELVGWARDHHRDPVLDHRRPVRRLRARHLLRRVGRRLVSRAWPTLTHRDADWAGLRVLVAGIGVSGFAAADALLERGARVLVVDAAGRRPASGSGPRSCGVLGAHGRARRRPDPALLQGDRARRDLAGLASGPARCWRRPRRRRPGLGRGRAGLADAARPSGAAPWLTVTGTNGKTTTVQMLEAILRAAGLRAVAAGNVGLPAARGGAAPRPVRRARRRAVQLPAALVALDQRPGQRLPQRRAGPPRLARLVRGLPARQGPGLRADPGRLRLQRRRPGRPSSWCATPRSSRGAGPSASRSGTPAVGMLGVVDDMLVRPRVHRGAAHVRGRAGDAGRPRRTGARPSARRPTPWPTRWPPPRWPGRTASRPRAVRDGLRGVPPRRPPDRDGRRGRRASRYVDDSKATNPHAAAASLAAFDPVVWVAGGLLKGAEVDDLVRRARGAAARGRAARARTAR